MKIIFILLSIMLLASSIEGHTKQIVFHRPSNQQLRRPIESMTKIKSQSTKQRLSAHLDQRRALNGKRASLHNPSVIRSVMPNNKKCASSNDSRKALNRCMKSLLVKTKPSAVVTTIKSNPSGRIETTKSKPSMPLLFKACTGLVNECKQICDEHKSTKCLTKCKAVFVTCMKADI